MGVPWDWGDVRLNSYALLTSKSRCAIVMSIRSQPDGEETRATLAAINLFGSFLSQCHSYFRPLHGGIDTGVILRESGDWVDLEIKQLMGFGAFSFLVLFIGGIADYSIYTLRRELEENRIIDKEVLT